MQRIDVHSHLLPGVDDGCKIVDESVECARMLAGAGYSHCFCTPHGWPNLPEQTRENVASWTEELQSALDVAGVAIKLLPGCELNLQPGVTETPEHRIISMGLGGKYILVDMWADKLPQWFDSTIGWLKALGLTVIMAHPERMRVVQDDPTVADRFLDMGLLLQGNLQCFADRPDSDTRRVAERFLMDGKYFLLGSDTHSVEGLKHRLMGLQNAIELAGDDVIDRLTKVNPQTLLPDQQRSG